MFGIVLISIVTLMHFYVFWRVATVPGVVRHVPRNYLIGIGAVLWAIFLLGRTFGHGGTGTLAVTLELLGMSWMTMLFLAFVSLLAMDVVTGFGFLFRRSAPSLRGWALIAGSVLSVIAFIQGLRPPVIQNYEVRLAGLPVEMNNTVIVAMSDLHLGSLLDAQWLEARVAQVQALRPDLVVLLGDLFEGHGQPQDDLIAALGRLSAYLGVWVVPGNHEFHDDRQKSIILLEEAGIHVLRNSWVEVRPGLVLAGVDDLTAARQSGNNSDPISQALANRPKGAAILLSHTPWQFEEAEKAGVGLMLAGHTHGGQVWPFDYLVRLVYPLLEGQYDRGAMTVIVCRGTGTWGPRMRLWRPSEILRITLHQKE